MPLIASEKVQIQFDNVDTIIDYVEKNFKKHYQVYNFQKLCTRTNNNQLRVFGLML